MDAQFARPLSFDEEQFLHDRELKNKRFGLQLWRIANGMVFLFFAFAYYLIRSTQASWPPAGLARIDATLPAIFSVSLLISALTANRAQAAIRRDNRPVMQRNILITLGLGLIFLFGLFLVWRQVPYSGNYSAIFFAMTGFHAFHVLAGMVLFGYVFWKAQRGAYSKESHWSVEGAVVFWHFIDLMWAFFFLVLYVL